MSARITVTLSFGRAIQSTNYGRFLSGLAQHVASALSDSRDTLLNFRARDVGFDEVGQSQSDERLNLAMTIAVSVASHPLLQANLTERLMRIRTELSRTMPQYFSYMPSGEVRIELSLVETVSVTF